MAHEIEIYSKHSFFGGHGYRYWDVFSLFYLII